MKKKLMFVGVFFIIVSCFLFYFYGFTRTASDILSLSVYNGNNADWNITGIKDGVETPITPNTAVIFDGTVSLKRTIPETWAKNSRIEVDSTRAVCVFVDDVLVFSNYKTNLTKPAELPLMQMTEEQPFNLTFTFNPRWVGKDITVLTRLYEDSPYATISFNLINDNVYLDQHEAWVNSKALPGAMFGLLSLLLFGLFLFELATEKKGYPILMLAVASLLQMFISMASLQQNPFPMIDENFATAIYFLLPLLFLGTRLTKTKKRYLVSIVFLWAIYFIIFILLFIFHVPMPYWADRVELICFIMLAITIYCCIKESKYNSFSKQFLVLSGISFITYLFIFILTSFVNLYLHEYIVIIFKEAQTLYCRPLLFWIFTTFLFILFILTVWEVLQSRIHNLKEVNEMKLHGRLLNLQMDSAKREIDFLKTSQQQSVIYRHDMRHHFSLINNYLSHNEIENAKEYVAQVQKDIDAITPIKYCENNTVNLILSSFTHKATELGVTLILDVKLPSQLSIPETDLCSVLSNGLENAITAASLVDDPTHKTVSLSCSIHNGKLLISIENTYTGVITFKDGLPQSNQYGHGFGTKSIALIAEKQNGFCTFEASDQHFILRFAIPLIQ